MFLLDCDLIVREGTNKIPHDFKRFFFQPLFVEYQTDAPYKEEQAILDCGKTIVH
jgi:hypothetical protein